MAAPATRDITIVKGDTFESFIRLRSQTPSGGPGDYVTLTGATATAQIRPTASSSTVSATFTCTVPTQTGNNEGRVNFALTAGTTTGLTIQEGVWDLQITFADGSVRTFISGTVTVLQDVTRA